MLFSLDKQLSIAVLLNHEERTKGQKKQRLAERVTQHANASECTATAFGASVVPQCHKTYTEAHRPALEGSYLSQERIVLSLRRLIEGNSLSSTERITDIDRNTITKLLVLAGEKCEKVMGRLIVSIPVKDVQADEIWGFVQKKEAHKYPRGSERQ